MPLIAYINRDFKPDTLALIDQANEIIYEYADQGFDLTLRQLYYQFVARGLLANRQAEYNRLGSIINDARLAGLVDWAAIIDRTRNLRGIAHWTDPQSRIAAAAKAFAIDKWANQNNRVEVWIEKDALVGVLDSVCPALDVNYFSCRGYVSASEMWCAAQRVLGYIERGQEVTILHLGDHDPSGIDMTRDIRDRLRLFCEVECSRLDAPLPTVRRIALTRDQIDQHQPPPNPAKLTDSRARDYVAAHGYSSWELDALDPATLAQLVNNSVLELRDALNWQHALRNERSMQEQMQTVAEKWDIAVNAAKKGQQG